ncbi:hypothetical protein ABIE69_003509, partial [Rhodobacteraceae bacterium MBR-64]
LGEIVKPGVAGARVFRFLKTSRQAFHAIPQPSPDPAIG